MIRFLVVIISFCFLFSDASAQLIGDVFEDEELLSAEVKQVNQFFRRFNAEEDKDGVRLQSDNPTYRNNSVRKATIPMLFDRQNNAIGGTIQSTFINKITDDLKPVYLDFHGGEWFAEVVVYAFFKGRNAEAHLYLKLQEEEVGSKWVLSRVYFEPFNALFFKDPEGVEKFLHPMSHELDFMNLTKAFRDKSRVEYFTYENYIPDYLSIFLYELKTGNLKYEGVKSVSFHFFQIPGYYFRLDDFNRQGFNTGWLISDLREIQPDEKVFLLSTLYHERP
jgi:hypothetical protein